MRGVVVVLVLSLLLLNLTAVAASTAEDPVALARAHIEADPAAFGLTAADAAALVVTDAVPVARGSGHVVYLAQYHDGIPVHNAAAHVAVDGSGAVVHVAHTLVPDLAGKVAGQEPALSDVEAAQAAARALGLAPAEELIPRGRARGPQRSRELSDGGIARDPVRTRLVYQPREDGAVRLAWDVEVHERDAEHWWHIRVDAATGEELDRTNLVTSSSWDAPDVTAAPTGAAAAQSQGDDGEAAAASLAGSYRVYAQPVESPSVGSRTLVVDPADPIASPFGWHDTDGVAGADFTITRGNNAHAYTDTDANNVPDPGSDPDGGASLVFDFPLDLTQPPSAYRPAAVTNLFYWANRVHDIWYGYGFDEASGNFQVNNYGRGGLGNDPMLVEVQDGGGTNNANMHSPVDGSPGRLQMYVWTHATPDRDGSLDSGIVVHELTHGLTNRLTGGPATVSCLNQQESPRFGWTDWMALMLTMQPGDTATQGRGIATYALGQAPDGPGIRPFRYSTDMEIDPRTYDDIITASVPHGVGGVFAAMLWEVTWALIDEHGFDPELIGGTGGNTIALQLVIDAMKLQPCNPGFVDARNAILAADAIAYGGANTCTLWRAFAKRGLGFEAEQGLSSDRADGSEAFDIPESCLRADLEVTSVADPPATVERGAALTAGDTTRNSGETASVETRTRYYLSADLTRDASDVLLGAEGRIVPPLAPGDESAGTAVVTVPGTTPVGEYHLLACADDTTLVQELDEDNNCAASTATVTVTGPTTPETLRLSIPGGSRIDTAVRISQHEFTDPARATRVYVARADAFPDALAGGSVTDGPILLTHSSGTLPPVVRDEIDRLDPAEVVALGGTSAVSDGMLDQAAAGRGRLRLSIPGGGRIDTAIAISRHVFPDGGTAATEVYLARADDFPDALAGGVLGHGPVLLVNRTGLVPVAVRAEIERLNPQRVIALGGIAAVGEETLASAAAGFVSQRLSVPGGGRTQTAIAIAQHAFPGTADEVYLARADQFPDALAGGALTRGPILLVPRTLTRADGTPVPFPSDVAEAIADFAPQRVVALGGTAAVADEVLQAAAQ